MIEIMGFSRIAKRRNKNKSSMKNDFHDLTKTCKFVGTLFNLVLESPLRSRRGRVCLNKKAGKDSDEMMS